MGQSLEISKMVLELSSAGVVLDFSQQHTPEEEYNYIIHQYDITFLTVGWQFQQETAELVYRQRKFRNQHWQPAWKPNT